MLDAFLEVSFGHTKEAEERAKTVELLKQLPNDLLFKIATGEEKLAFGDSCQPASVGEENKTWVQRFQGTDLFEKAIQLEQQDLELRMQNQQRQSEDSARMREQDSQRDQLSIQRKMLELELASHENGTPAPGGEPAAQEVPAAEAAQEEVPTTGAPPQAKPKEEEGGKAPPVAVKVGSSVGEQLAAARQSRKSDAIKAVVKKVGLRSVGAAAGLAGAGVLGAHVAKKRKESRSIKEAAILMKAAYLSEYENDWLSHFVGTPLFDKAMQIEEATLAAEAQEIQNRVPERQTRETHYDAQDQLRLQKRQLSLELARQQAGGGSTEEVAPPPEAMAEGAPPAPPGPPAAVEKGPPEAEAEKVSSRMKLAMARMKIASGARYEDLTELEKKAFGAAMLAGLKGMGQFAAGTGKNVMQAAKSGGGIKAVGQTLGGAARMGATQAANFAKANPMAAAGLAGGAVGAAGLGGMALGRATN